MPMLAGAPRVLSTPPSLVETSEMAEEVDEDEELTPLGVVIVAAADDDEDPDVEDDISAGAPLPAYDKAGRLREVLYLAASHEASLPLLRRMRRTVRQADKTACFTRVSCWK